MNTFHERPTVLELCAGGGGQALGLEQAGFRHLAAIEIDSDGCATLKRNRPEWEVLEADIRTLDAQNFEGVDLVAAGVPCPPFSIAGKQLGSEDPRDLFPSALRVVRQTRPRAVLLENVRGLSDERFREYRRVLFSELEGMGYLTSAQVLNASGFSVPQLRPRFAIVALQPQIFRHFRWPVPTNSAATVGETLGDLMSEGGWPGAKSWANRADQVAPTLVGGSKKHGGPDLGPTRARAQWRTLGVDGLGIANEPPGPDCPVDFMPKLTLRMTARLQGFPDGWLFAGGKTSAYRQIGNAFPPPVARAIGEAILAALGQAPSTSIRGQSVMFEASTRTILAADQS